MNGLYGCGALPFLGLDKIAIQVYNFHSVSVAVAAQSTGRFNMDKAKNMLATT